MIAFLKQFSPLEKGLLFLVLMVYLHNLFITVMQVDAAQYACISAEMARTNSYLEVKEFQGDYLDKPPLLFWLSSLTIKLFGTTNFGYKIASFLFILASLYAVYRFTVLYYSTQTAKNAVIILATTQAYFLITNDIRTDALLTSCSIISIWLFAEFFEKRKLLHLVSGSVFMGLALLAKGPIGAIVVLMPIGLNLMYQQKWRDVFNFRWILVIFIAALILVPMSYGLYTQFDAQPEKGKSGLYFYYWLQSFGRITGENVWNNGAPWHFFLGSSIWDFFPWIFPLYIALFFSFKNILQSKSKVPEITTLVGLIAVFAMLSLSKYKLPHYVFVTFPFAAVIVARYLTNLDTKIWQRWKITNYIFGIIILILFIVYGLFFFVEVNVLLLICIACQALILFYFRKSRARNVAELVAVVVILNVFLSFVFYPKLLTFQADSVAGRWVRENIKNETVYTYKTNSSSFNFHTDNPFTKIASDEEIKNVQEPFWIYVNANDYEEFKRLNVQPVAQKTFDDYPITRLKLKFLLEKSRPEQLKKNYLIKIAKP